MLAALQARRLYAVFFFYQIKGQWKIYILVFGLQEKKMERKQLNEVLSQYQGHQRFT